MTVLEKITEEIVKGDSESVEILVEEALSAGISVETILNEGLIGGMNSVSDRFKNNECFIPEVLVSAKAMKTGLEILKPHLIGIKMKSPGKVVIGTIFGDLHDIGKNIVSLLLQGAGFQVVDLGANVPIDRFVEVVKNEKADIVGISALLITTMINMKTVIEELKKAGLREKVKIIVGGAPVTQDFATRIGADGYAPDAASGVDLAKRLLVR